MSTRRIRHAVWLYARFTLSYRDVEELLAERGLDISYETIRRWELKFELLSARRSVFRAMIDSRTGNGAIDDAEQDAPLPLRGRRADYRACIQLSENASAQVLNG